MHLLIVGLFAPPLLAIGYRWGKTAGSTADP
jgi:hypothetical protein